MYSVTYPATPVKRKRKTRAEKAMDEALTAFQCMQEKAEERFRKWEEERWQRETELEERRRKEDKAHELELLKILMQSQTQSQTQSHTAHYQHPLSQQHDMYSFMPTPSTSLLHNSSPKYSPTPSYTDYPQ